MSDTPITDAAISTDYYCSGMVDGDVARDLELAANAMEETIVKYLDACPVISDNTTSFYEAHINLENALAQYRKLKP